jgi:hypothetical protein
MTSPEIRRALSLLVLIAALARPALGQPPPAFVPVTPEPGFLSRVTMVGSVEALSEHETDYYWDADVGVGVDVVDFRRGRVNVFFNYEMVLGSRLQPFDPWQGNYTIDVLGTVRQGATEWGVLFRHVSRHLGDRRKDFGIAWNDLGVQVLHARERGAWRWQARGLALATVMRGFVDYAGDVGGDALVARRLSRATSLVASVATHVRLVEDTALERGAQWGGRAEVGVRVDGGVAGLEIVAGVERRVDANAFEFAPRDWAFAGLRIVAP